MADHDTKSSTAPLRRHAKLKRPYLILLGILVGGTCPALSTEWFLGGIGFMLRLPYVLFTMALGSVAGIFVALVLGSQEQSPWIVVVVTALIGLALPIGLMLIMFLSASGNVL